MDQIIVKTHAKINLTLDVVGKREDGYHDLCMVMQSVSLHDRVMLKKTKEEGISLSTNLPYLPINRNNIAYKAAELFFSATGIPSQGLSIHMEKHIPVAAGLAGGSSNGAGVLFGLNRLFDAALSPQELRQLGLKLGADVPFSLLGGTALAEGVGEILTPLAPMPNCHLLLVKPRCSVSTPKVFGKLNLKEVHYHPDTSGMLQGLESKDLSEIAHRMYNVLETVTGKDYPEIGRIEEKMLSYGALGSIMSGSGPTVFGVFQQKSQAESAFRHFRRRYRDTFLCTPSNLGIHSK